MEQTTKKIVMPSADFVARANVSPAAYERMLNAAAEDVDAYWADAADAVHWFKRWETVCEWTFPFARWFVGGTTNAAYNCIDRHLKTWRRCKAAIIWEGEPGDRRVLTYQQLHNEVSRVASALVRQGLQAGDRVALYLPAVPELIVSMLACARIGVTHNAIFEGYGAGALRDRLADSEPRLVITADGRFRSGRPLAMKATVDEALAGHDGVECVAVLRRTGQPVAWASGRDIWWDEFLDRVDPACDCLPVESEHPLFILYTSGTTGKPKGIIHSTGGYLVGATTTARSVFDIKDTDVVWTTSNPAWPTGHTYVVYGTLSLGSTVVIYEGDPDHPDPSRLWDIAAEQGVNIFYTFPNDIRRIRRHGQHYPQSRDLSQLRLLGSVSEPLLQEDWEWLHTYVGRGECPINDTWWQTETGATMITSVPGAIGNKPGSVGKPFPGISAAVVDDDGNEVAPGVPGNLVVTRPWPSMLRGVFGSRERYYKTYWEKFAEQQYYFPGDRAVCDADGYFWILGRLDDIILVRGLSVSPAEVESRLLEHPATQQAAVVGRTSAETGHAIVAYVVLRDSAQAHPPSSAELREHIAKTIGDLAVPENVYFVPALPTTKSGKVLRRLLRDVAQGDELSGDVSALDDRQVIDAARRAVQS